MCPELHSPCILWQSWCPWLKIKTKSYVKWKKNLQVIDATEFWWMFDVCLSSATHIWWQLLPGGWHLDVRTDPWCWPHSRSPASVSLSTLASVSLLLLPLHLACESSSPPQILSQTRLIGRGKAGWNVTTGGLRFCSIEGRLTFKSTYQHQWLSVFQWCLGQFLWQISGWQC